MQTQPHSSGAPTPRTEAAPRTTREATPWTGRLSWSVAGIIAGAIGALTIATFFLIVDAAMRQALWTPTALGSALFQGEQIPSDASPSAVLVLAYTAVHAAVFLSIGMMAAYTRVQVRERGTRQPLGGVALTGVFFVSFEALMLAFLQLAAPGLVGTFGLAQMSAANLLAAAAMAGFLTRAAPRLDGP